MNELNSALTPEEIDLLARVLDALANGHGLDLSPEDVPVLDRLLRKPPA